MGGQHSSLCVGAGSDTLEMTRPSTAWGRRTAGACSAGFLKGNQSQHGCCRVCSVFGFGFDFFLLLLFFFVCFPFLAFFFVFGETNIPCPWGSEYGGSIATNLCALLSLQPGMRQLRGADGNAAFGKYMEHSAKAANPQSHVLNKATSNCYNHYLLVHAFRKTLFRH